MTEAVPDLPTRILSVFLERLAKEEVPIEIGQALSAALSAEKITEEAVRQALFPEPKIP